jgi:ubiquinone/menaquinone biosynthesis C-methylase UbiE
MCTSGNLTVSLSRERPSEAELVMTVPAHALNPTNFPELYERWLVGPLFQPWAETLLDRVHLTSGDRVLDVACGTGIVARLALRRLSGDRRVVGVDVSPQMLTVARAIEPGIDWRQGNASALPLLDGEHFDVVACHQGLQFFPDKSAAAREMRRATAPGGRLIVAVWQSLEETPFFRELHALAERHLGAFVDRRHSFGDSLALERLLADAGFADVRVESLTRTIVFSNSEMFVRLNSNALVGMSAASSKMADTERTKLSELLAADSAGIVQRYMDAEQLTFELGANVATARAG